MTEFEEVLETILEEYARRDTEGDFDTWEKTDSFVKEKAEVLLAYANLQEEPASEDLEEAAGNCYFHNHAHARESFIEGANWQKKKDFIGNEPISEELDEAAKRYATEGDEISGLYIIDEEVEAFKAGAQWKEQQIMKDAVDACVTEIRTYKEENEVDFTVIYEKGIIPYEIEQEVKLIIIKED